MSDKIIINGKSVAVDDQKLDASESGYILIRTTGEPLNRAQKLELATLGVKLQEFVGQNGQQLYLCGFENDSLERVRKLSYIDYANVYSQDFVIPDVLQSAPMSMLTSAHAGQGASEQVEVDVLLHHDISTVTPELLEKIAEIAQVDPSATTVSEDQASPIMVRIKAGAAALEQLAELDEVRVVHPVLERALFNNVARRVLGFEEIQEREPMLYDGSGQTICVCDTGFDMGSTTDVHDAFLERVKGLYSWGRPGNNETNDPDGHGTHVCGSVLGSGQHSSEGTVHGAAPAATLLVQSMFVRFNYATSSILGGYPQDLGQLFQQAYDAGARVHSNSWGTPMLPSTRIQRPYDTAAASIDKFVWDHQSMTIVFAAGNEGQDTDLNGTVNERSLGAEASAKNCITIGACESYRPDLTVAKSNAPYSYGTFWPDRYAKNPLRDDHLADNPEGVAAFSSRGPTAENRLKPDLIACGTAILSAKSRCKKYLTSVDKTGISGDARYMYLSGTSMATPLVSGCCAVVRQALYNAGYEDVQENNPTASLIKALLINGAVPIRGQYMPEYLPKELPEGLPNPHSGFGRVNIAATLANIKQTDYSGWTCDTIDEEKGKAFLTLVSVPLPQDVAEGDHHKPEAWGFKTLKVTMAYADLPGAALANDLNLVVVSVLQNKERHGNQGPGKEFAKASKEGFDRDNNVEQVVWPDLQGGDQICILVKPYRLMSEKVPFALVWKFT
ncbi:subtilisin-like protease [Alternaria alternata]|uniref:Subtilisin-like protease n=1 Tax=Alternaria alternata TaxID=5599 RepID=A0A177DC66_ALTAL|nr:subtilisin-like protease [Alternaria alternata]OAG16712.1 subtilisin-like protease [Alternaria alternata]